MDFMTAVKTCLVKKYVCFEGRASRSEFWYFQLFLFALSFAGTIVLSVIASPDVVNIYSTLVWIATFLPSLGATVRRLHDTDHSGWWYLIVFTIIGAFVLLYWCIIAGTDGENSFGPDPLLEDVN